MSNLKEHLKSAAIGVIGWTTGSVGTATMLEGANLMASGKPLEGLTLALSTVPIVFAGKKTVNAVGANIINKTEKLRLESFATGGALSLVAAFAAADHFGFWETVGMTKQDNPPVIEQQKPAAALPTGASVYNGVVVPAGLKIG
jgi:hypothetical protein